MLSMMIKKIDTQIWEALYKTVLFKNMARRRPILSFYMTDPQGLFSYNCGLWRHLSLRHLLWCIYFKIVNWDEFWWNKKKNRGWLFLAPDIWENWRKEKTCFTYACKKMWTYSLKKKLLFSQNKQETRMFTQSFSPLRHYSKVIKYRS